MIMERFDELKKEILCRAHEARACTEQYGRAYRAETLEALMQVVRDNFHWCCINDVIDGALIDAYREEFNEGKIWHNEKSITEGFMLMDGNSRGEFYGNSQGVFYGNSRGEFYGNSQGEFYGNSRGEFYGNSQGVFYGNSQGVFHDNSRGVFHDNSRGEFHGNSRGVFYGNSQGVFHDNSQGVFYDNSRGEFHGNSQAFSYSVKECRLHDYALYRITSLNEVRYADPDMRFVKVEEGE